MTKKILWLTVLSFSLAGGFLALKAQDPAMPQPKSAATSTQPDLSGTYAGTFNCEAAGLTGDTTLTINGNEFTTADGKTGRIVASKSAGYTAVAFQVNGADAAAAPTIISLRARKYGNKLTLTSLPDAMQKCSFVPSRAMARNRKTTPAATGTEVSNPATAPTAVPVTVPATVPTESPMPAQTPVPTPSASPTPSPSPTPSGSPTPVPSPSPGEPTPSPSPNPSPSPRPV